MKKRPPKQPWIPMQRATITPKTPEQRAAAIEGAAKLGIPRERIEAQLDKRGEVWKNHRYTVFVDREEGHVTCLSIKRTDRKPIRDWRDFQRIKNEIAGEDVEGVEIYPAEDRLVDTANQYFIWCFPPGQRFPGGFTERSVSGPEEAAWIGAVQRSFDE